MWSTAVSLMISFVFSTIQMVSLADFLTWSLAGSLLTSLLHSGCWRMCWPIRAQSVGVTEPIRSLCWKVNRILLVIDMCDHSDIFNPFPCGFMFSVCSISPVFVQVPSQVNMRGGTSSPPPLGLAGGEISTWTADHNHLQMFPAVLLYSKHN